MPKAAFNQVAFFYAFYCPFHRATVAISLHFKTEIMGADVKNKHVKIYIDHSSAETALETLQRTADKLTKSIDAGRAAGKNMAKEIAKLDDSKAAIKNVQDQIDKGLRPTFAQATAQVTKLRNELKKMSEDDPRYAEKLRAYQRGRTELDRMSRSINDVKEAENKWLSSFKAVAYGVSIANVVTSIVSTVKQAIFSIISLRSEFEKSVANLSAITGAGGNDLEFLKNAAIDLSTKGATSAKDYVEAMKLIASAKPELLTAKEDLVEVTRAAQLLASASGLDLPTAATKLTDALNQFGAPAADAAKYVDALAAAAKFGSAEVPELTDAIVKFGSIAKASNIDIYESSAAVELLGEHALKGADAGTALRNVLIKLSAVEVLPKDALASLKAAGVSTDILKDKSLSLEKRLTELSKIKDNDNAITRVFGAENLNAGQIILQNLPRYAQLAAQIKEQGVAAQQAATNTNTLEHAWDRFKNILAANVLSGTGDFLKVLITRLTSLVEPAKSAADEIGELKRSVNNLEKDILPLTTRVDELKEKAKLLGGESKLSKDEQVELNKAINTIAANIPSAIIQWDNYGNAIGISTEKAREFITLQQNILKVKNKSQIDDFKKQLNELNKDLSIKEKTVQFAANDPQSVYSDAY